MESKKRFPRYRRKVLPPIYMLTSIVLIVILSFLYPIKIIVPFSYNLLGLIPLSFGLIINLLADKAFKEMKTTVKPFQHSTTLVTHGVYRISRNPMYLGFTCMLLGVAILMGCLSPYLVPVVFAYLIDRVFIREEEQMLEQQFKDNWWSYKKQPRRWI